MKIGEVSIKYNMSADTLRYYEKIGLFKPVKKVSGIRNFDEDDLKQLDFIICMKNSGFELTDIVRYMNLYNKGASTKEERLKMLMNQKDKLKEEINNKKETMKFLDYKISLYKESKIWKNKQQVMMH